MKKGVIMKVFLMLLASMVNASAFMVVLAGAAVAEPSLFSDDFSFGSGDRSEIEDGDFINDVSVQSTNATWYTRDGSGGHMVFRSPGKMGAYNVQPNNGIYIPYDFSNIGNMQRIVMKATFTAGNQMKYGGTVNGAYLSFNGNSASLVRSSDDIDQITLRFVPNQAGAGDTAVLQLYCNSTNISGTPDISVFSETFTNYAFSHEIELMLGWSPDSGEVTATAIDTVTGFAQTLTLGDTPLDSSEFALDQFNTISIQTTGMDNYGSYSDTLFDDFKVLLTDMRSVSVLNYGAVPDDGLDDADAIQSSIHDLETAYNIGTDAKKITGVSLELPAGTYDISHRLEFVAATPPTRWGGITVHGDGMYQTFIRSRNDDLNYPDGAFYFLVESNRYTGIQIEDIAFRAAESDAGPAVEIESTGGSSASVRAAFRNVDIRRVTVNDCYTYGIKGRNLFRPLFDDVAVWGIRDTTVCGIYLEDTYAHNAKDCTIVGADTGFYHHYAGGEGNFFNRMCISNVNTGIKVEMMPFEVMMSTLNGALLNSTVSARECGLWVQYKDGVFVANNTFESEAGSSAYRDVELVNATRCFITGNTFAGFGINRTGINLVHSDALGYGEVRGTMIADNTFGALAVGVCVGTNTIGNMVINNDLDSATVEIEDHGIGTLVVDGIPDPVVSPAAAKDNIRFVWGDDRGEIFNVREYGALGDGVATDTAAIQAAAADMVNYLNGADGRTATLYFPSGIYILTDRINITQAAGDKSWARVNLLGDGMWASSIYRGVGGNSGVFNLNFQQSHVEARVVNLMLIPVSEDAGTAISVTESVSSQSRSLYMLNVRMRRILAAHGFSTCIAGTNLSLPFFENVYMEAYGESIEGSGYVTGATGVRLRDGVGFTADKLEIIGPLEKGLDIEQTGGDILIKSTSATAVGVDRGGVLDAGGGTVAIEAAHFDGTSINLDITNASAVSFMNTMTLTRDGRDATNGVFSSETATIRLRNCDNITIRNNYFSRSYPSVYNPYRKVIWLSGSDNSNAEIYGNLIKEPGQTGVYIDTGTENVDVLYNRFTFTDIDNVEDHGTGTVVVPAYELNGELGAAYLVRSTTDSDLSRYLHLDGTSVDCGKRIVDDDTQWMISYEGNDLYSLMSCQSPNLLLEREGDDVDGDGIAFNEYTKWDISGEDSGIYSLLNHAGTDRYLDYDATDLVDCNETAVSSDEQRWELIKCRDVEPDFVAFPEGIASLLVTCNRSFTLYFNGDYIGAFSGWDTVERLVISLSEGTNVIAVACNRETALYPGLLAEVQRHISITGTDSSWKVSTNAPADWQNAGFNDSSWANATEYSAYGNGAWRTAVEGMPKDTPANWIWTDNTDDSLVYFRKVIIIQ